MQSTQNGKGSRNRTSNFNAFRDGHANINWGRKEISKDELELVQFSKVQIGDTLFVGTETNKKGEFLKVAATEIVGSGYNEGPCIKIVLENKDEHFGWGQRLMKKAKNI
jgi:hypothetical protein